jgi:hypothetical protein
VANFQDLIAFVNAFGAHYNPSKAALQIPQLNALHTAAENALANVIAKNTTYNNKVNERVAAFKDVKPLATRLVNALQSTDASSETIADAKGFNKKLQGYRAKSIATPLDPNSPVPNTISNSQQSYDQQIQHLAALVAVLQNEPTYTPNEVELQTGTLTAKIADLTTKNNDVATAYANVSVSRNARNATLYSAPDNLIEIASEVKKYVKAAFGANSPEYANVSAIAFKKPRK